MFNFVHTFPGKLEFLPTLQGAIPTYQNYTFSYRNDKKHLCCSKRRRGKCNAKLVIDSEGYVIDGVFEHCHSPPIYYKSKEGLYCRVK